jgi:hypothetical protein
MKVSLGDYVNTLTHGHTGRVYAVHHGCPEGAAWMMGQEVPIREEAKTPTYRWLSILVQGAGSVVVPEYDAEKTDPFPFSNPWASHYWAKDEELDTSTPEEIFSGKYADAVQGIVDTFHHQLCDECGNDLDKHAILPDGVFGLPYAQCLTADESL